MSGSCLTQASPLPGSKHEEGVDMVLRYYNLKRIPFAISPDPKFFWLGRLHKKAMTALLQGIVHQKNLMLLTGEKGIFFQSLGECVD